MNTAISPYLKFLVALLGAAATAMQTAWPSAHWSSTVTAVISAALVYLVPNVPKGSA